MLKNGKWSKKYDKCIICGTTDKEHKGNGICRNCYNNKWNDKNSEICKKRGRERYKKYPERIKGYIKKYYLKNKEKHKKLCLKWQKNNPEKVKEIKRKCRIKNWDKNKKYNNEWRKINHEKVRDYRKKYYFKNKKKYIIKCLERKGIRLKDDFRFKLKNRVSWLVWYRLRSRLSSKNGKSTFSFLPYTVDELKVHLEKQFKPGMSWTNYGDWHIDHIKPDCKFDYKNMEDEEFRKCWALENLQPLWAEENLRKSGKY